MEMALTAKGYSVCHARTGRKAVDRMLVGVVDYLVLDPRLPVPSGREPYIEPRKRGRAEPTVITGYAVEDADGINAPCAVNATLRLVEPFNPVAPAPPLEGLSRRRDR